MTRSTLALCLTLASCSAAPALAGPTFPDRGRAGVVDAAGVIPDAAERALNSVIVDWDKKTGRQFVVATVPSLGGLPIADYGVQLGRRWGLGHKGSAFASDGVILLLAPHERKVRIEVGYGLEPVLTDAVTSVIIRDRIVPKLKANDTVGALNAGAAAIIAVVASSPASAPDETKKWPSGFALFLLVVGLPVGVGTATTWAARRRARRQRSAAVLREAERVTKPSTPPVDPIDYSGRPFRSTPPRLTRTVEPIAGPAYGGYGYSPPPPPPPPSYDYGSSSSSSSDSSDFGSWGGGSDSSSSSSSDSGFDSGGGSFGGGGADSSY